VKSRGRSKSPKQIEKSVSCLYNSLIITRSIEANGLWPWQRQSSKRRWQNGIGHITSNFSPVPTASLSVMC
jgi:hypothetical protein